MLLVKIYFDALKASLPVESPKDYLQRYEFYILLLYKIYFVSLKASLPVESPSDSLKRY